MKKLYKIKKSKIDNRGLYASTYIKKDSKIIEYKGKTVVFAADLIPTVGHIPVPYIMSYDTRPLLTLEEKSSFLKKAEENNWILFMEHDPDNELAFLKKTERGVRLDFCSTIKDFF